MLGEILQNTHKNKKGVVYMKMEKSMANYASKGQFTLIDNILIKLSITQHYSYICIIIRR
jgi:hypothetical protein